MMDKNKEQEYRTALAAVAKSDPEALAAMLVEFIQPNHITTDYIGMVLNTRNLNPGDQLFKRVRRGIQVRTLYPGSIHLSNEVTVSDRAWYNLSGVDIRVHANQWDLESGQIGTLGDIEAEMRAKLKDYYFARVVNALGTLWDGTNTPDNWTSVGGYLTATALEDAIDWINYRVGGVKVVVGTKRALTPITKFGQYTPYAGDPTDWGVPVPSAIEEVRRTGFLGTYYGCKIMGLDQLWDNPVDMNPMLAEHSVLVIGNNVGEFITYGDVKTKAWTNWEPTPPYFNIELYQQYGMIIDNQEGVYVIDDLT